MSRVVHFELDLVERCFIALGEQHHFVEGSKEVVSVLQLCPFGLGGLR